MGHKEVVRLPLEPKIECTTGWKGTNVGNLKEGR
jgi:hypothetical protein